MKFKVTERLGGRILLCKQEQSSPSKGFKGEKVNSHQRYQILTGYNEGQVKKVV